MPSGCPPIAGLAACALAGFFAPMAALAADGGTAAISPQGAEFFEARVRPVLAENCFSCHGPAQQMAAAVLTKAQASAAFRATVDDAARRVLTAKQAAGLLPC